MKLVVLGETNFRLTRFTILDAIVAKGHLLVDLVPPVGGWSGWRDGYYA